MEWYIARHGQTEDNASGKWSGQTGGVLTKEGIEHARRLGLFLRDVNPDEIWASDLDRAYHTAVIAADVANYGGKVRPDQRLREIDWGQLAGKTLAEIQEMTDVPGFKYHDTLHLLRQSRGRLVEEFGIESLKSIEERRNGILSDMIIKGKSQSVERIVTVTHSAFTAYLFEGILHGTCGEQIGLRENGGLFPQRHSEISVVNYSHDGLSGTALNKSMYD